VLVVLGAWVGEVPGASVVRNADWASGLSSSLRAGLAAVVDIDGADRVVVIPVDLPGLTPSAVQRVLARQGDLVAAAYGGVRGHPVVLGRPHWVDVMTEVTGDRGARDFLAARVVTLVEVGDLATGADLDTARPPDVVALDTPSPDAWT
jgi:nicotine blue oxidoreductase